MRETVVPARATAFRALAAQEIKNYLRHPLFIIGLVLTALSVVFIGPEENDSSLFQVLVPATAMGVFGVMVMAGLVRRSDKAHAAAGAVVVSERQRTLALASAAVVPFTVGLLWYAWAIWAWHAHPAKPNTVPGEVGDDWAYAVMFALGVISTVGGPILGLVVGRWLRFRGAPLLVAVLLVMATIMMQGIIEPLRYVRVFMPFTWFGGPNGVEGDPERWVIFTGSPYWYCGYLVALCALGVLVAALHDREQPRGRLAKVTVAAVVVALALGTLSMTMGVQDEIVNPLPGPAAE
jgi:hypothetical protein